MCASRYSFVGNEVTHAKRGTWYTPKPNKSGYPEISFRCRKLGITQKVPVHRVVAFQKYGEKIFEPGIIVRHKDNNKLNFDRNNILIGTALDNHLDNEKSVIDMLYENCRKMGRDKRLFDDLKLAELRELRALGMSLKKLAVKYGCSKSTISLICSGATYKDSFGKLTS